MTSSDKKKTSTFLSQLPMFNELDPLELARIADSTTELRFPRGAQIFQRGDPCLGFHTVVYGQVKLAFNSSQGTEKVVEIIGPGHSFGEALMFMDKSYIVSATTLADSMILHVEKAAIFDEIERDPKFARKMLAGLSRRLHGLVSDVQDYALNSGKQRVIGFLLKDIDEHGNACIMLNTAKSVVASRLNLTPEHFSRILHELNDAGMIAVRGKEIQILDIERLRSMES